MMSEDDKQTFEKAKPYIIGILAFVSSLVWKISKDRISLTFDYAEAFVKEWEKRNEIDG